MSDDPRRPRAARVGWPFRRAPTPALREPAQAADPGRELAGALEAEDWDAAARLLLVMGNEDFASLPKRAAATREREHALFVQAMAWRDSGRPQDAADLFGRIGAWSPASAVEATVEQLLVHLRWKPDAARASQVLATLPPAVLDDPRVALFTAVTAARLGGAEDGSGSAAPAVPDDPRLEHGLLAELKTELAIAELKRAGALLDRVLASAAPDQRAALRTAVMGACAYGLLRGAPDFEAFRARLGPVVALPEGPQLVVRAALSAPRTGEAAFKAYGFAAFTAFRYSGSLPDFADAYLPDPALERDPLLLQNARLHEETLVDPRLRALCLPLAPEVDRALRALVSTGVRGGGRQQARRVLAREAARAGHAPSAELRALPVTPRPAPVARAQAPHVFVGLFGQLRYAKTVAPALVDRLRADLAALGGETSFGLATWNAQGHRALHDGDPAWIALTQQLPREVVEALGAAPVHCVADVAARLPNVVSALRSAASERTAVDEDYVRQALGWTGGVEVDDDARFLAGDGARIVQTIDAAPSRLNQGRMWSRLEALGRLARAAEARAGRPVDAYVLLRTDLRIHHGGFAPAVARLLSEGNENAMAVDHDGWASFCEGLGDRYLVCGRAAAARVFDGRRIMQGLLEDDSPTHPDYRDELAGHIFLASLMFEHGTDVRQLYGQEIGFEIYRGRLDGEPLWAAVRADAQASPDAGVRERLEAVLAARDASPVSASGG